MAFATNTLVDSKYQILRQLGAGGMGDVYLARQNDLQREVAIKVLSQENLSADALSRFQREALALSNLNHPGVVTVYGFGLANGLAYLVMEYVKGKTLFSAVSHSGPMPPGRALAIMAKLCDAVAYTHRAGIVHRDLKPDNVIVLETGSDEDIKIIDLGLARVLPEAGLSVQKITETGLALGSVHYMSPEQCFGQRADQRSDIYSMGAILHFCLMAETPFDGVDSLCVMKAQVSEPLPELRALKGEHPQGLQEVIRKSMAKNPSERYQTVDEMLADIELVRSGSGADVEYCESKQPLAQSSKKREISGAFISVLAGAAIVVVGGVTVLGVSHRKDSSAVYAELSKLPEYANFINPQLYRWNSVAPSAKMSALVDECLLLNSRDHSLDDLSGVTQHLKDVQTIRDLDNASDTVRGRLSRLMSKKVAPNDTMSDTYQDDMYAATILALVHGDDNAKRWNIFLDELNAAQVSDGQRASVYGGMAERHPPSVICDRLVGMAARIPVSETVLRSLVKCYVECAYVYRQNKDEQRSRALMDKGWALASRPEFESAALLQVRNLFVQDFALRQNWPQAWKVALATIDKMWHCEVLDGQVFALAFDAADNMGRHQDSLALLAKLKQYADSHAVGDTRYSEQLATVAERWRKQGWHSEAGELDAIAKSLIADRAKVPINNTTGDYWSERAVGVARKQ